MSEALGSCPHCAAGNMPQFRDSSSEWVHRWSPATLVPGGRFTITLCVARTPFVSGIPDTAPVVVLSGSDRPSVGLDAPQAASGGVVFGPAPRSDDAVGFQGRRDGLPNG
jgi:hypothetical protein